MSAHSIADDPGRPQAGRPRVVLADDDAAFRAAVRTLLAGVVRVVGEASNGREAIDLAESERPDLVLLDMEMPVLDGLGAARGIRAASPATRIIVLSGSATAAQAAEAGVELLGKHELERLEDEVVQLPRKPPPVDLPDAA